MNSTVSPWSFVKADAKSGEYAYTFLVAEMCSPDSSSAMQTISFQPVSVNETVKRRGSEKLWVRTVSPFGTSRLSSLEIVSVVVWVAGEIEISKSVLEKMGTDSSDAGPIVILVGETAAGLSFVQRTNKSEQVVMHIIQ